jgi:hypothetical protein
LSSEPAPSFHHADAARPPLRIGAYPVHSRDEGQQPDLEQKQRESRAIWWDKRPADLARRKTMDEGRIPQAAYVYQAQD